ncbi:585_t:CDS:1, partial [Acaulospora colombiana]
PIFHNDLTVKKVVSLNRCLIDSISPLRQLNSTGSIFDNKVDYNVTTPIISFREGGLVTAEITLKTLDPHIVVKSIEYGLKEEINYRTTGEHVTSLVASIDENVFPLGKKKILLDQFSHTSDSVKISFHLCPWVNCDVNSELIYIEHKIVLSIEVTEKVPVGVENLFDVNDDDDPQLDEPRARRRSILNNFSSPHINNLSLPSTSDEDDSNRLRHRSLSLSPLNNDITSMRGSGNNRNRSNRALSLMPLRRNDNEEFATSETNNR